MMKNIFYGVATVAVIFMCYLGWLYVKTFEELNRYQYLNNFTRIDKKTNTLQEKDDSSDKWERIGKGY